MVTDRSRVNPTRITSDASPRSAMNSQKSVTPTSSQHSSLDWTLQHELGRDQLKATKELVDIATRHAFGEEAIGLVFVQGDGKMVPSGNRGAPPNATVKCTKRSAKGRKKGQKRCPNESQLLPAAMTRKRMALMRSMS
jgi:hypothetical protein